ncbi:acyl-CoA dehydratase activase [uncultured Parolsenella sp.]|uniref:acyl-CoA dehydratase activase n=1 Tax=uncultured Parolsenella sp. TaxID=2083008 RepID=UPI0025DF6194|nr:acyl-CoA dehydratase activase [uncultured Parolsenella sp.]
MPDESVTQAGAAASGRTNRHADSQADRHSGNQEILRASKQADELVVHYPCKYVPVELLAGFGVGCWPCTYEAHSFEEADQLAHPNLCGYGKSLFAYALQPEVHALVLTSCCDVMRRVYDVLSGSGAVEFLWLLDLPHLRGPREVARFRGELRRLAEAFSAWSGREFNIAKACASFVPPVPRVDERVTLLGAHGPLSLVDTCRDELGLPVENGTCTGWRLVQTPPPGLVRVPGPACEHRAEHLGSAARGEDGLDRFLDWYADALLNQMPCMRMNDAADRKRLVGAPGQHGVIYHTMKFCDYYGFEYLEAAKEAHTPMLKIETDGTRQSAGQLRTRLKAFDETLRGMAEAREVAATRRTDTDGPVYVLGVDSGSTSTDAVVMDADEKIVASVIVRTGAKASAGAAKAVEAVLERAGLTDHDLTLRVATGYGRDAIPGMDSAITEITCHARGAHFLAPDARTVIDIGGQDSKVIYLDEAGGVLNFVMNDKCAAGTGRFLEATARAMELDLDEFCRVGLDWKHDVKISNMCTVFAESEVVSLVADDTPIADIVHGLDMSVASKTAALAKRVKAEPGYLMTGGLAQNVGVVRALEDVLGAPVATHEDSQLCGAIGAALLGLESLR